MIKKEYIEPSIIITCFNTENVVTVSGVETVAELAKNGQLTVGGEKLSTTTEILAFNF